MCFVRNITNAQSTNFTLGIILPVATAEINQVQIQKLETKIAQIINISNEATVGYFNDFVVYPVVSIDETSVVEGGMQNITVSTIDFSLFVKQLSSNLVYNAFSKKLKGSGNNKAQAITNAFNQIKVKDEIYLQFIKTAKAKIFEYYNDNCKLIIKKAGDIAAKQDYEQALGILQSIPSASSSCYNEAQKKSLDVYKKYQTILCTKNVNRQKPKLQSIIFQPLLKPFK